jgi:hypothetical protein
MVSTPPLDFDHKKGFEIPTKHKEAIRQLYWFGKIPKFQLQERYHLGDTTIDQILAYEKPERKRANRVGKPKKLTDAQVDVIIEYLSESYENRCLDYNHLVLELKLNVTASTPLAKTPSTRLFSMRSLSEALPHCRTGPGSIRLGDCTYILDSRVVKGPLVGRGYISSRWKDSKTEGHKEKGGENLPYLHTTLVSPWAYHTCERMGGYWIWI